MLKKKVFIENKLKCYSFERIVQELLYCYIVYLLSKRQQHFLSSLKIVRNHEICI